MSFANVQPQIVAAMRAAFPDAPEPLAPYYGMMQYHLGWLDERLQPAQASSGKLLRPLLVLLANRALGGRDEQALPLAAGVQLLHDFSLIHDDIEDNSATRRGRTTAWRIWGVAHGINAGDGMFVLARRAIHQLADVGVPPGRVLRILREFEEMNLRLCEGQYLDISAEGQMDQTVPQYVEMIRGKTAALAAACAALGAQVATDDAEQIAALRAFGAGLGLAFQMQDDLLDIWGDPAITGKPRAADLIQRKMSLPVIHGLAHASAADRTTFTRLYSQSDLADADIDTLLAILERTESQAYTEGVAHAEYERAMHALDRVTPADQTALNDLRDLAQTLLKRVS